MDHGWSWCMEFCRFHVWALDWMVAKAHPCKGIVTDVLPVGAFANGKKTSDQQKGHLIVCFWGSWLLGFQWVKCLIAVAFSGLICWFLQFRGHLDCLTASQKGLWLIDSILIWPQALQHATSTNDSPLPCGTPFVSFAFLAYHQVTYNLIKLAWETHSHLTV